MNALRLRPWVALIVSGGSVLGLPPIGWAQEHRADPIDRDQEVVRACPVQPDLALRGGGMNGNGWDGPGQGPATIFWHVEGTTPDIGAGQRQALIDAMQAWADVVQITFQEIPVPNANQSVDWRFLSGDHCASEAAECGNSDCPFDGAGGLLAHAGFPVGAPSTCVNPMPETWAGNVHFDEAETWEQEDEGPTGAFSLTLIAAHEVGHSIGLLHDTSGGGDVMKPLTSSTETFNGLTADDIASIRSGYASGIGTVLTLNDTGIWVDTMFVGVELGTQTNPFDRVSEGINGVPPFTLNIVVHINAGAYPESMTITAGIILQAENGSVTIGS